MADTRNPACGCQNTGSDCAVCGTQGLSRGNGIGCPPHSESVYIDVNRILDSCRDKDCFENVRVYFPECGQQFIDHASSVRARAAEILDTCINVSPMTFNRGFYQISARIYVRLEFEVCVGGKPQCLEGLAAVDKSVILFGSEGSVRIFRSKGTGGDCCGCDSDHSVDDNLPTAVLEIVDPVVLSSDIIEPCGCRPSCGCVQTEVPEQILRCFGAPLTDPANPERLLTVTLGFFSVMRMERPAQILVSAAEYAVPDKECVFRDDESPASAFRRMAFPTEQFQPPTLSHSASDCRK